MGQDHKTAADILRFVLAERTRSVSDREWRHRLAGYGYAVKERAGALWLTTLPAGRDICALDG